MPEEITLPLITTAAEQRASWSAEVDGHTLRATAIPYSDNVYVFRLEKYLDDKLIEGENQFYAIDQKLRKAPTEEMEHSHAANEPQWQGRLGNQFKQLEVPEQPRSREE